MISKEVKDKLDLRLVNGEITKEQYDEILSTIGGMPAAPAVDVPEAVPLAQVPSGQSNYGEPPHPAREPATSGDSASGGASVAKWAYLLLIASGIASYAYAWGMKEYDLMADYEKIETWLDLSMICFSLAGIAFWANVYVGWKAIQGKTARTTPGKAVGFLLIPFFNLYWMFNVLPGLATDIEKSEGKSHVSFGLAVLGCIAVIVNMAAGRMGYRAFFPVSIISIAILAPLVFQISKYASKR